MEVAPWLAYLAMKVNIHPNTVTTIYAIMGILGGIFIAVPLKWLVLAGIFLFYFRGCLDWADGLLARATGQTTITGDCLDPYGAHTGWVALWTGMGLYVANQTGENVFFYLAPIAPITVALNAGWYAHNVLYGKYVVKGVRDYLLNEEGQSRSSSNSSDAMTRNPKLVQVMTFLNEKVFAHHAGSVDLVCLIILIELFVSISISWIIYLAFLSWHILFFVATFYVVARGGWVENELEEKVRQVHNNSENK